jgi:hypothetical protein
VHQTFFNDFEVFEIVVFECQGCSTNRDYVYQARTRHSKALIKMGFVVPKAVICSNIYLDGL